MPHEVTMPQLGMAQDSGKIVVWLKSPGDAVAKGDALLEVETDKTTMEVEAQADGFLSQVTAADGEDVPVGQVIAMITASADDAGRPPAPPPSAVTAAPVAAPAPMAADPIPAPAATAAPESTNGKILASPKARRLAQSEGLDLNELVKAGHPQPYHVSDIEVLRTIPTDREQTVIMAATKQITARTPRQGSVDFIDWMKTDGNISVPLAAMFASFAAGAFRAATQAATVILQVSHPNGVEERQRNPDFTRLSVPPETTDDPPMLVLHDLTESFLSSLRLGDDVLPTLSIGADGDSYLITFEFGSDYLTDTQAIAFINGLAQRLADPLHQLV